MSALADYLRDISGKCSAFAGIDPAKLRQAADIVDAADTLLEELTIDGSLSHSDACGCGTCEAQRSLRAALVKDR